MRAVKDRIDWLGYGGLRGHPGAPGKRRMHTGPPGDSLGTPARGRSGPGSSQAGAGPPGMLTPRAEDILDDPEIDIVIELIGGLDAAKKIICRALENKKHVVTANKALLAHAGNELFAVARRNGRTIAFEAAVAGGIPLIKALREGLAGNRIDTIFGILNGTANYILSAMSRPRPALWCCASGSSRKPGYAEADPTLDIEGTDAAHKLAIACAMAFGSDIQFDQVYVEGISQIDPLDIQFVEEFGYRLKLLAIGRSENNRLEMRVHPTMIPSRPCAGQREGRL